MIFDVECDLRLTKDGRTIMGAAEAGVLRTLRDWPTVQAASKRLGVPTGDLLGSLASINQGAGRDLVSVESDDVSLTAFGEEALRAYDLKRRMLDDQMAHLWRKPYLTTDGVLFEEGKVLLVRRDREPGKGMMALPGGIVEYGETVEQCVAREVREETGISVAVKGLIGVFSDPLRDPRGHFISLVFRLERKGGVLMPGDDAAEAGFYPVDRLPPLAFDHSEMIAKALDLGGAGAGKQ